MQTNSGMSAALSGRRAGGQKDSYSCVVCPACTEMHFVHATTGKVFGEK
jgi:Fe-S oxidoreductase